MKRSRIPVWLVLAVWAASASIAAAQTATAIVEGRVIDAQTSAPLVGAVIAIQDTTLTATADRDGRFRLAGVPAGRRTLVVTFLGRHDKTIELTIEAGSTRNEAIAFDEPYVYRESLAVTADVLLDAQARALNQQKQALNITNIASADQIGSFPDSNAAETTQRMPGIAITKDQGEGRYVSIRGTDPRLNSMLVDGERIPSPDPLIRQVALDVVPSELLRAIEVSKALTPDMDGDAIGGAVNLVMKQAPEKLRVLGHVGTGYNQLGDTFGQNDYGLTAGRRMRGGSIGAIVSVAGSGTNRANNDMEAAYTSTLGLMDFDPRYYEVNRRRVGVTGALDFKASPTSQYTFRGVYNRFIDDHEKRNRMRERISNRRIERERRDRTHIERITSGGLDGRQLFGNREFDFRALVAYSDQTDPLTMTTTFRQSNVNFAPNVSADSIDPDNIQPNPLNADINLSTFNSQVRATNFAKDRDIVGAANLRLPLTQGTASTSFLKVGLKYRDKQKGRTRNETTITTSSTLRLTDFLDSDTPPRSFLDGRYDLLPFIDQAAVARIPDLVPVVSTRNHARDAEEFDGTERTAAGYAMAEIYRGPLVVLPGLRYEYTSADYTGRDVHFAPNGTWVETVPIQSKNNYGVALPSLQTRWAVTPNANLRAAVTRSIARPNYYDTVPYFAQDDAAGTIAMGNADLAPTSSWNVDFMGEQYFKSVGVVSGGVFYKRLEDYIYTYTFDETKNGAVYHVTQPQNGDVATVWGVELTFQNQLSFLPGALGGIGVYTNYTFTDSDAAIPGHEGSRLPGQARHMGNVAVSYERYGFTGRVAMNFHGSYLDVIGASNSLDRYYDQSNQLDISIGQKLTRNLRLYADFLNTNDALLRYYQGVPERVLQEEHYHWWSTFGIRVAF